MINTASGITGVGLSVGSGMGVSVEAGADVTGALPPQALKIARVKMNRMMGRKRTIDLQRKGWTNYTRSLLR
jgi:hypothetical protein